MTIIIGLALVALGLAVGFVVAWALGVASAPAALVVGVLLLIAGAVIGFVSEWLIDEAYRKNRELRRQLGERSVSVAAPAVAPAAASAAAPAAVEGVAVGGQGGDGASGTLADFLRQRDVELRDIRERMSGADEQMDAMRAEFDAYQRSHPDDLTVIKGIGPVYQWKLRDAGCNSYKQLAAADPEQLRRMLDVKNWQRVNIEGWISQARDWAQRG